MALLLQVDMISWVGLRLAQSAVQLKIQMSTCFNVVYSDSFGKNGLIILSSSFKYPEVCSFHVNISRFAPHQVVPQRSTEFQPL